MQVELHTFQQIMKLTPSDMLELVATVGTAAQLSNPLYISPYDKILVAHTMLHHANTMLEQCGCIIETTIKNPNWADFISYKTKTNNTEKTS
jgi:hypothetical protein